MKFCFCILITIVLTVLSHTYALSSNALKLNNKLRIARTVANAPLLSVNNINQYHSNKCNCFTCCSLCAPGSSRTALFANKLDNMEIEGDLVPAANNCLIKVKEAAVSTAGGLYIPDNAKERPTEGVCVAAGPGRVHPETAVLIDMGVKVGDGVLYGKFDGTELKYNDLNHQLIKDDDVLLTYSGKEATLANVVPVKDQILVKLPPKEDAVTSGIIVSVAGKEAKKPDYGTAVKIGSGRQAGNGKYMPIQVAEGDKVRFRSYAGAEIKLDGAEYIVIRAYDVLAKWK